MRAYMGREADYQLDGGHYQSKGVLLYRTKTIKAGDYLECEMYPVLALDHGQREKRQGVTKETQKKINLRNAQKRLARLMNANFGRGDLLAHLTEATGCTEEQAARDARNFVARLRTRFRRAGKELKYIYVIEETGEGPRKRHHIHMALTGGVLGRDEIEQLWGKGLARVDRVQAQEKGLTGFAQYITQRKTTQEKLLKRRWACSKNLRKPQETVSSRKFSRRDARQIAEAAQSSARTLFAKKYPGYRLVEEPEIKYSEWTAGAYIYAFLVRETA